MFLESPELEKKYYFPLFSLFFVEMYRRGLKVNEGKRKVMVLGGEENLEYEVYADGIRLEHVSELS